MEQRDSQDRAESRIAHQLSEPLRVVRLLQNVGDLNRLARRRGPANRAFADAHWTVLKRRHKDISELLGRAQPELVLTVFVDYAAVCSRELNRIGDDRG